MMEDLFELWCSNVNVGRDGTCARNSDASVTVIEQQAVEASVFKLFEKATKNISKEEDLKLNRNLHINYLFKSLKSLSSGYSCLDASRTWLVYWIIHALNILNVKLDQGTEADVIDFLSRCQCASGGFGGGPQQIAHLAPTYSAVNALVTIGTPQALAVINRQKLADFLYSLKDPEGSFRMHIGGEVDIRGTYCAISVAKITHLALRPLFNETPKWIIQCQTYEGGFSGSPGLEAHGGYTFCGYAGLALLQSQHLADTSALLRWVTGRQMKFSGGFQGRTNKLVDGCYSFWQGALFPILHRILSTEGPLQKENDAWLFHTEALQNYILLCCQSERGGLIDKPGKNPDCYHSCYVLSGLSVAQNFQFNSKHVVEAIGNSDNEVALIHPLYNICTPSVITANDYFGRLPQVQPHQTNIEARIKTGLNISREQ